MLRLDVGFSKRTTQLLLAVRGEVAAIREYNNRFSLKDSLAYLGSILWNIVNYNGKTTNVSFKE